MELQPNAKVRSLINLLWIPKGTMMSVSQNSTTKDVDLGKTGKILCNIPSGGALFFAESELERVE